MLSLERRLLPLVELHGRAEGVLIRSGVRDVEQDGPRERANQETENHRQPFHLIDGSAWRV
jgi:hypothetical protein